MITESPDKPLSPWLTMWQSPRQTIRRIVDTNPRDQILLLSALITITWVLNRFAYLDLSDNPTFASLLPLMIEAPAIVYLMGALLHWFGKRLGGTASVEHLRAAYAWSWVPTLWILPLFLLFGARVHLYQTPFNTAITIIMTATAIFSYFASIACISEVQGFSKSYAFASRILSDLMMVVLFAALDLFFFWVIK
jgi:hypothetical protein